MAAKLHRAVVKFAFKDGAAPLALSKVLTAHLYMPLIDSGVPKEKVYPAARSIAESFRLLGEGEYLRLTHASQRPFNVTEILLEEYDKGPRGYKSRVQKRLGCSEAPLRPVIKALRNAGQLGGELRNETRDLIKCGARRAGVRLDAAGIARVAKRLALLSVPLDVKLARAEIGRRKKVAAAQRGRPSTIVRYGLAAEVLALRALGKTIEEILDSINSNPKSEVTRDMVAKFLAKSKRKQ